MSTLLRGRVWKFGDDLSGDDGIIEFSVVREQFGKLDEVVLKAMCFRKVRPEFPASVKPGDIVVGGRNFAHHNHVEVSAAIKYSGIAAVVCESCETGFLRKALNFGLPVVVCPGVSRIVKDGETIEVDPVSGRVEASGGTLAAQPFSERMVAVWKAGGLVPLLKKTTEARRLSA